MSLSEVLRSVLPIGRKKYVPDHTKTDDEEPAAAAEESRE